MVSGSVTVMPGLAARAWRICWKSDQQYRTVRFVQWRAGLGEVQSHRFLLLAYFGLVPVTRMYAWSMYHWPGFS